MGTHEGRSGDDISPGGATVSGGLADGLVDVTDGASAVGHVGGRNGNGCGNGPSPHPDSGRCGGGISPGGGAVAGARVVVGALFSGNVVPGALVQGALVSGAAVSGAAVSGTPVAGTPVAGTPVAGAVDIIDGGAEAAAHGDGGAGTHDAGDGAAAHEGWYVGRHVGRAGTSISGGIVVTVEVVVGTMITDGVDPAPHGAGGFASIAHAGGRMDAHGGGIDGGIDDWDIDGHGLLTGNGFMVVVAAMTDSWGEQGMGASQPGRACGSPDAANDGSSAAATATASMAPEKRILRSMTPIPSLGMSGCPYQA